MCPDPTDPNTGVSSSILLRGGLYELESTYIFERLLRAGDTVIDIGANIGWYTLLSAKKVGPHGRVVACEPEPHNFELLEASVRLNQFANVTLLRKGVSDRTGKVSLHLSPTNAGGHTIMETGNQAGEITVDCTTIDELVRELSLGKVDVVKIDAEYSEPLILLGARALLSRGQPSYIMMEYSPDAWVLHEPLLLRMFNEFDAFEIYRHKLSHTKISDLPRDRQGMLLLIRKPDTGPS